MANEVWAEVYDRIAELVAHRTTLVFVNTAPRWPSARRATWPSASARSTSPRTTAAWRRSTGCDAEQRLKAGSCGAGGHVVARARHRHRRRRPGLPARLAARDRARSCSASAAPGTRSARVPKGRLFPLSRDDLVECAALLDAVRRGELDRIRVPRRRSTCWRSRSSPRSPAANGGEDALYALLVRAPRPTAT
jgi:ATP-dependent helicase Lhr and Lhr-like helicase